MPKNDLKSIRKRINILLLGPYLPLETFNKLNEIKNKLKQKGYAKTFLVKDLRATFESTNMTEGERNLKLSLRAIEQFTIKFSFFILTVHQVFMLNL